MKSLLIAMAICIASTGAIAQGNHGHSHDEDGHAHGEHHDLGTTVVASISLEVFQLGDLTKAEGVFEAGVTSGTAKPRAIRMWVGVESAEGSVKAKADDMGDAYEAHVELPSPMPKNAKLWVEVQPAEGKKVKASFDLKK